MAQLGDGQNICLSRWAHLERAAFQGGDRLLKALTPPKVADLRVIVGVGFGLHTRKLGPHPGKDVGDLDWTEHGIYALNGNVTLKRERQ